jgi:ApaG protein
MKPTYSTYEAIYLMYQIDLEGLNCLFWLIYDEQSLYPDRDLDEMWYQYTKAFKIQLKKNHLPMKQFLVTNGVKVEVESFYQRDYSNPLQGEYMFAYKIQIENHNDFPVQLLLRHWTIFDSCGIYREVEGEGVVGVQPILRAGEGYNYVSGANLHTDMGTMKGEYLFKNTQTGEAMEVRIPAFDLIAPFKLS